MKPILSFKKIKKRKSLLYDEFFAETTQIHILAFNYDDMGSALCRCDGTLQKIGPNRLERILFGIEKQNVLDYLQSLYDMDFHVDESPRHGDRFDFKVAALKKLSRFDAGNLAKQTRKELAKEDIDLFRYYEEIPPPACTVSSAGSGSFCGNSKSKILHRAKCKRFKVSSSTVRFKTKKEALSVGYKLCTSCNP